MLLNNIKTAVTPSLLRHTAICELAVSPPPLFSCVVPQCTGHSEHDSNGMTHGAGLVPLSQTKGFLKAAFLLLRGLLELHCRGYGSVEKLEIDDRPRCRPIRLRACLELTF